jgi:hypothetical protein
MTTTNLSINSLVSEEEQRFLQALPFLVSFGLTLYMPIAARKNHLKKVLQEKKRGKDGKRSLAYFCVFHQVSYN